MNYGLNNRAPAAPHEQNAKAPSPEELIRHYRLLFENLGDKEAIRAECCRALGRALEVSEAEARTLLQGPPQTSLFSPHGGRVD